MTIAYVTVKLPYGKQETFIIPEIEEVLRLGHKVLLFPCRPDKSIFHTEAENLKEITHRVGLFSVKIFIGFCLELLRQPFKSFNIITRVIFGSRNLILMLKNLTVIPKSFYAAKLFRKAKIEHIHAHWASTPSSIAYVSSYLTNIPWSFTAHRWDIVENNILKEKCKTASFVRVINENGKKELIGIIKDSVLAKKISVIHMGVVIPKSKKSPQPAQGTFTILCPANLVYVKGHRYLFEACKILSGKVEQFKCLIAGDGLLREELETIVKKLDLNGRIEFLGKLPHDKLLQLYEQGAIHAVVLPSIETEEGEKEGTPVALMEAMSYGIPVISTDSGGIPELIGDGGGIMVKEKDAGAIAKAIENLIKDLKYYDFIRQRGREKIEKEFDSAANAKILLNFLNEEAYEK